MGKNLIRTCTILLLVCCLQSMYWHPLKMSSTIVKLSPNKDKLLVRVNMFEDDLTESIIFYNSTLKSEDVSGLSKVFKKSCQDYLNSKLKFKLNNIPFKYTFKDFSREHEFISVQLEIPLSFYVLKNISVENTIMMERFVKQKNRCYFEFPQQKTTVMFYHETQQPQYIKVKPAIRLRR